MDALFHSFGRIIECSELPEKFNNPFYYTPHPLCVEAADCVRDYLEQHDTWRDELEKGKMFGVLLVRAGDEIGYLAAFSGLLCGHSVLPFFVPPVYDLLDVSSFFKKEEAVISALNRQIEILEHSAEYRALANAKKQLEQQCKVELDCVKAALKEAKRQRDILRSQHEINEELRAKLIRESQFQKAELKRLKQQWNERLKKADEELERQHAILNSWKCERKALSAVLQQRIFEQFDLYNAKGEMCNLYTLFQRVGRIPPAGSGECAAPKLLQYAYRKGMRPLAMAEFWVGNSPKNELRKAGCYYPSCKEKCEPILNYMLQGLEVVHQSVARIVKPVDLEVLYEDESLVVVNKPEGMLSVPGKDPECYSVYRWMKTHSPEAEGPLIVHRLDMATSGILLLAKSSEVYKLLQRQFECRTVLKRYIAWLDGVPKHAEGDIILPLCADVTNRPTQMVHPVYGKFAQTHYKVLECKAGKARVAFFPLTGRTHQIRVHAAHAGGLGIPICGDELYGCKSDRLYLHAEYLSFTHPITGKRMEIEKRAPF